MAQGPLREDDIRGIHDPYEFLHPVSTIETAGNQTDPRFPIHNSNMAVVLFFGPARERTGRDSQDLPLSGSISIPQLWERLLAEHPGLASLRDSCRIAVDQEYASADSTIGAGSEIAIIPPVAGG